MVFWLIRTLRLSRRSSSAVVEELHDRRSWSSHSDAVSNESIISGQKLPGTSTCTDATPCLSMMLAAPAADPADDGNDDGNDDGGGGAAKAVALAASAPAAYVAAFSLTARTASAVAAPLRPMPGQPGVIAKPSVDAVFQSAFQDRVPLQKNSPSSSRSSFSRFVASRKEHACIDAVFQSAFQDRVPLQKNSPDADMLSSKVPFSTEFHCERTRHRAEAPRSRSHDLLHPGRSMRRPYGKSASAMLAAAPEETARASKARLYRFLCTMHGTIVHRCMAL